METDTLSKNLFETFDKVGDDDGGERNKSVEAPKKEPMKVVLRIKPFTAKDISHKESRGCVVLKNGGKVELRAPQDSFQFKSSIRGLTDQTHDFSFSRVFDDTTHQQELFGEIMLPFVKEILDGQNGLVFTYGVTNSGKTYTIQGTPKDGGILPRALDVIFNSISKKLYTRPNLKPKHCQEVLALTKEEEESEELLRKAILSACEKENVNISKLMNSTSKCGTSSSSANSTLLSNISMIHSSKQSIIDDAELAEEIKSRIADTTTISVEEQGNVKFGVWVSFMEIYNELIYDLLDLTPIGRGRKRAALKLGDDRNGKPYVKGLKTIFVTSSDEAYKVLRLGQNNRHMAATKLNQQSSRSHCIFDIKLLKIVDVGQPHVARISRLSIVDLAGSERYCKTGAVGDLLRQAGNINASIMTLGKCISTLRYNQEHPNHQTIIPFRESKLTRLFQNFFLGKGKASMIVNISQCASVFDETYHVLKFSAVAKQIKMKAERATELWKVPPLPKIAATPSNNRPPLTIVTPATSKKRTLQDPTEFTYDELVNIVGELRDKVRKERLEKANIERNIRKEVSEEMNELIVDIEQSHSAELLTQKHQLEGLMEKRLDLLTKVANKRKRKKMDDDSMETSEVSIAFLEAEKIKVKERDDSILTLQSRVRELEAEHNFLKKAQSPENRSQHIEMLSQDLKQTKETLAIQNEGIERMQNMLQSKDDEIDKLREVIDDDEDNENPSNTMISELQEILETTTKELDNARVKLDNRDIRIRELEKIVSSQTADNLELTKMAEQVKEWHSLQQEKNKLLQSDNNDVQAQFVELEKEKETLKKDLESKTYTLKETDELLKTVQFENDETSIKLDRYESVMKDHQNALTDNETFIEQLNQEVLDLKLKLKEYEGQNMECETLVKQETATESVKLKEELEKAENKVQEYGVKIERLEKQMHCYESIQERTPAGKLKIQSMVRTPDHPPPSPFKQTPVKKLNATPKSSPYSPATKTSSLQTIKKLEKLLDETSKALDKKNSQVVQKNNRVQQLESQVTALEKKTAIKELRTNNSELESKLTTLEEELLLLTQKKSQAEFQLVNEEENSACLQDEVEELTKKCEELESGLSSAKAMEELSEKRHEDDMRHHCLLLSQANEKSEASSRKIDELGSQVNKAEELIANLTTNLEKSKKDECDLKFKIAELHSTVDAKTTELEESKAKIIKDKRMIESLSHDKEKVKESTSKLQKQLEDRRKSRMFATDNHSTTVEGYESRIKILHQQVEELEDEKSIYQKQVEQIASELKNLQNESQKVPAELESLKTKENEMIEKIRSYEETKSKLEIEIQTSSMRNTKLDMRINAMESEMHVASEKLSLVESENREMVDKIKHLSNNLNKVTREKLDLEQVKTKIENDSEKQFKNILSLEKQKSESDAIISSYKENVNSMDSLQNQITKLEQHLKQKDKELQKYKEESKIHDDDSQNVSETQKENIELKESLKLSEFELKRVAEEKKFALDELLKQTVKNKRKHICMDPIIINATPPSDRSDPDFITPKRTKNSEQPGFRRLTRSTRKCKESLGTIAEPEEEQKDEKREAEVIIVEDGPAYTGGDDEEEEEEYVCSVSIALSPLAPFQEEEEAEEEETEKEEEADDEGDYIEVGNGQYVTVKDLDGYASLPIIGKVCDVTKSFVTMEMMYGAYSKQWKDDIADSGEPVTEKVHRSKILCNDVRFTNAKRLPIDMKRKLQKLYLAC